MFYVFWLIAANANVEYKRTIKLRFPISIYSKILSSSMVRCGNTHLRLEYTTYAVCQFVCIIRGLKPLTKFTVWCKRLHVAALPYLSSSQGCPFNKGNNTHYGPHRQGVMTHDYGITRHCLDYFTIYEL